MTLEDRHQVFDFGQGKRPFSKAFIPALGYTQPPGT